MHKGRACTGTRGGGDADGDGGRAVGPCKPGLRHIFTATFSRVFEPGPVLVLLMKQDVTELEGGGRNVS